MITNGRNRSGTPVAIVTGGSHGVGRAVARKLASADFAVVISYLDGQPAADAAVAEILGANGAAVAVRADVADELDVERLFREAIDAFGHVDVVVHAAARMTSVLNQQASLQLRDGGAVVNIASSPLRLALPSDTAYAAGEGAADATPRILACELGARDITLNAIALGPQRAALPTEIASLIAYLVSEEGHWVNGQVIHASR